MSKFSLQSLFNRLRYRKKVIPAEPAPLSQDEFNVYAESLYKNTLSEQDWQILMDRNKIDSLNSEAVKEFQSAVIKNHLLSDSLFYLENILEGDTSGFAFFQSLCHFEEKHMLYMQQTEREMLPLRFPSYIARRLENIEYLGELTRIAMNTHDAYCLLNNDEHKMTFFDAGNLVEAFEADCDILPDNTRAKIYFLLAKAYQKIHASPFEQKKISEEEIDYLNKTLTFAADYKLIFAAQKRLGKENLDEKIIVDAYKRALKNTKDKKMLYRINNEIARLYTEFSQISGFIYAGGPKEKALGKAEYYYYQALHYAEKESQLAILKNIAAIQAALGNNDKWLATKTEIAMKHLSGSERCKALIKIASRLPKQQAISFYERAINEAKKSKISPREKAEIIQNSCYRLETLYSDPHQIETLKNTLKRYCFNNNNNTARTPVDVLNKYTLKKEKDL